MGKKKGKSRHEHVVIAGAGIVGVSTAIWLQRGGYRVTLIDPAGVAGAASYGNGGVLTCSAVVPVTVPGLALKAPRMLLDRDEPLFVRWPYLPQLLPFLAKYLPHGNADHVERVSIALSELIGDSVKQHKKLAKDTRARKYLHTSDFLFGYASHEAAIADAYAWNVRFRRGLRWQELNREVLNQYDPTLGTEIGHAYLFKDHGHISDPGQYLRSLAQSFRQSGGQINHEKLVDIQTKKGRVVAAKTESRHIDCDHLVLATGAWSNAIAPQLGINPIMESERGYHVDFHDPSSIPRAPIVVTSGRFVITPMEGYIRAAGIVEFGGLKAPPQAAPFELLISQVKAALPGLTYSRHEKWMGHRPAPADSLPVIGRSPILSNAYVGFGHHHIGLTAGPKTGRILASMIAGTKPEMDVTAFSPVRFGD